MTSSTHRKIRQASLLLMGSIILSRIVGFFREWALAQTVGATALTDVYYASFTIPDFLNHLMAAGALSISFIPMLSGYLESGNEVFGKRVFQALSTAMGCVLIVFILVCELWAAELANLIAPGFDPSQKTLLVQLLRLILPAQFFFYWGGLAISVQQTYGRFFLPAVAPIVYNFFIIVFGVLLHRNLGVMGFSIGILVGSFLGHGLLQWVGLRKLGYPILPSFVFPKEIRLAIKRYFWLTFPIMISFSVVVTDEWVSKYFASFMERRALSWLSYARTEMRIPIAIIGQAAGIASFPFLARLWEQKDYEGYGKTLLTEIEKLWAAGTVAALILIVHALPITQFIYGGGRFTHEDLLRTTEAVQIFGIGVFFWTVQVVLARGFYACGRTWLPSIIGTVISLLGLPFYYVFGKMMGYQGLAWAGTASIVLFSGALWLLLLRHLKRHVPNLDYRDFNRFCTAWIAVIAVIWLVAKLILAAPIYRHTRISALLDILVVSLATLGICLPLLRTYFRRFTGEPLF
ncbi:MAG: murein biosynthesis integral membrane protein MurJ [Deltaproteobacteria bacterium]|nr:murein biosynthesis integral membrane protein MurJ [Deltaproteobacteria bacterium]